MFFLGGICALLVVALALFLCAATNGWNDLDAISIVALVITSIAGIVMICAGIYDRNQTEKESSPEYIAQKRRELEEKNNEEKQFFVDQMKALSNTVFTPTVWYGKSIAIDENRKMIFIPSFPKNTMYYYAYGSLDGSFIHSYSFEPRYTTYTNSDSNLKTSIKEGLWGTAAASKSSGTTTKVLSGYSLYLCFGKDMDRVTIFFTTDSINVGQTIIRILDQYH